MVRRAVEIQWEGRKKAARASVWSLFHKEVKIVLNGDIITRKPRRYNVYAYDVITSRLTRYNVSKKGSESTFSMKADL